MAALQKHFLGLALFALLGLTVTGLAFGQQVVSSDATEIHAVVNGASFKAADTTSPDFSS